MFEVLNEGLCSHVRHWLEINYSSGATSVQTYPDLSGRREHGHSDVQQSPLLY